MNDSSGSYSFATPARDTVPLTDDTKMRPMEVQSNLDGESAPRLKGLDGSRFIAACMIISYHLYDEQLGSLAHAGASWVTYFFFLSGFVLAYQELTTPPDVPRLSTLRYLKQRLIRVYPIYAFTLLTVIFEATRLDHTKFEWHCLPLHFFMAQSWFPICSSWDWMVQDYQCCSTTWNSIAWFMSTIIPFWLLGRAVSALFRNASVVVCLVAMTSLWLWTIIPALIAHFNVDKLPGVRTWDFVMIGPFGYWHVFTFGIPAAQLFIKLCMYDKKTTGEVTSKTTQFGVKDADQVHWIFRWGAVIGYSILLLFFSCLGKENYDYHWAFYHSGGFLPILLLVVLGLASGHDPVAQYALSTRVFACLGTISYAMYLLQFRIWWLMVYIQGTERARVIYPFVLVVLAYVFYATIEVPYMQWQRWRAEKGKLGADDKAIDFMDDKIDMACAAASKCCGMEENLNGSCLQVP